MKKYFFFGLMGVSCVVVAVSLYLINSNKADAGGSHNVRGWIWAEAYLNNGVEDANGAASGGAGWISLNSLNCDPDGDNLYEPLPPSISQYRNCPQSGTSYDYGVNAGPLTGNRFRYLTGYAWSDNYGWIVFGSGAGTVPTVARAPGTVATHARINNNGTPANSNDDYMEGWARVVSQIPDASNPTSGERMGGWDGWISLRKTGANAYSVSGLNGNGWGWGSALLGWMRWDAELNPDMCTDVGHPDVQTTVPPGEVDDAGNCYVPATSYPASCGTAINTCGPNNAPDTSLPDTSTRINWTCNGTGPNPIPSTQSCSFDCGATGGTVVAGVCVPSVNNDLTPGTYNLSPRLVTTPSGSCYLSDWTLTSAGNGAVTCSIDGLTVPYPYNNVLVPVSVGTHTFTCTDSSTADQGGPKTVRFTPDPVCRLNPGYGEF